MAVYPEDAGIARNIDKHRGRRQKKQRRTEFRARNCHGNSGPRAHGRCGVRALAGLGRVKDTRCCGREETEEPDGEEYSDNGTDELRNELVSWLSA